MNTSTQPISANTYDPYAVLQAGATASSTASGTSSTVSRSFKGISVTDAIYSTLLSQAFDLYGLETQVSLLQSTLASYTANPMQVPSVDSWLKQNGFAPEASTSLVGAVAGFASTLDSVGQTLGSMTLTRHNAGGAMAANLRNAIIGSLGTTQVVRSATVDYSGVASSSFDLQIAGNHVVTAAGIGITTSDNRVSFDSSVFSAAYAADPYTTLATFNAFVSSVAAVAAPYPSLSNPGTAPTASPAGQAAKAYLTSAILGQ